MAYIKLFVCLVVVGMLWCLISWHCQPAPVEPSRLRNALIGMELYEHKERNGITVWADRRIEWPEECHLVRHHTQLDKWEGVVQVIDFERTDAEYGNLILEIEFEEPGRPVCCFKYGDRFWIWGDPKLIKQLRSRLDR